MRKRCAACAPVWNESVLLMNSLYNAGICLMAAGAKVGALRSDKLAQMLQGHARAIDDVRKGLEDFGRKGFDVWFHAASLGEFEQARPMIEALTEKDDDIRILLTFFSPSGYNVRRSFHPHVCTVYLPFDKPENARAFIEAANPKVAVFIKYEFWGNYLHELYSRGIPTYLVSAIFRPSQIFFKPWGGLFRKMLGCYTHIYVQDEASRELLENIGIDRVTVAGDTRLDRVADICSKAGTCAEAQDFLNTSAAAGPALVFGSSWPADEKAYIPLLRERTDLRAIIAPHEFDGLRIEELRRLLGPENTAVLSEIREGAAYSPQQRFLIIDNFGLLSKLYRYADIAYVGGGFGAGIHNINEAAAFSKPVVFGRNSRKFKEAADLCAQGGAFRAASQKEVIPLLTALIEDEALRGKAGKAAGEYISSSKGASKIVLSDIFPSLFK